MTWPRKLSCLGLLAALAGLATPEAWASEFMVTNWRTEEGLPHSIVNSIVQTRDGYLWIATYVGLARFDGVRFVHYWGSDMPELGNGRVSKLFEDREGTLWIGMESGRLLARKDGVMRIHLPDSVPPGDAIIAMAQDATGTIWLQTAEGRLGRLTEKGVDFVAKSAPVSRSSLGLVVDRATALWVGTSGGLKLWQNEKLITPPGLEALGVQPVEAMAPDRDGGLWIFGQRRLRQIQAGGIVQDLDPPAQLTNSVVELLETASGCLWLAAVDGTLFYHQNSTGWETIPAESGLRGANKTLYEDREGNVWRGSFGGGLSRLRPKLFTKYELPPAELDRYALSICPDAGGGVWALLNSRTLSRITPGNPTAQVYPETVIARTIRVVLTDDHNSLWAGTENGYLYRLKNGAFVPELRVENQVDAVNALFEDAQSNLWAGYTGGAGVGVMPQCDPARWRVLESEYRPDVRTIAQAADGALWFGTHYGGALRWNDGHWTRFTVQDGLSSDYVRCFHTDTDGTVWLGTMRGLCRWRDGKFSAIKSEDGLWNESISCIEEDRRGNFWVSSFGGVFRVPRQGLVDFVEGRRPSVECIGYNRNDGLPSQECPGSFRPAGAKSVDGRLWFPTVAGVVSVAPDLIAENKLPPPVGVESVSIDGAPASPQPPASALEVGPGKHRLEFRYTALSLVAPEKVRFRHQLEGLDREWSIPDDQRTAVYSFVPPGRYTFRVTACNNDGVWSQQGAGLAVIVRPFFWQTWWFKMGLGLALVLAVAGSVRRFERWKALLRLRRLEQQHALDRERARIAEDIHDDLGASLTQIAFLSDRVEAANGDGGEIERANQRIRAVAHRTIQSLDEIVWAVSPKHDTLESLANYLSQFAQEHLALAGVPCVLEVPAVLPAVELSAEVRHNLLLATREALQNVVAHAGAAEVRVALRLGPDALEITVADNGCGFDPDQVRKEGNGLPNMRRRLAEIGGELKINRPAAGGSVVQFRLPRSRLHVRGIAPTPALE